MMKFEWYLLTLVVLVAMLTSCTKKESADLVIYGGPIYTVAGGQPVVEAVAVIGDRITYAGSRKEAEELIGDSTEVVDLMGKAMYPGFIEGHGHIMGVGYNEMTLNLANAKSFDEIIERVKTAVSKVQPGEWIVGEGWHQDKWDVKPDILVKGFPVHNKLSEVSPDNPVFLVHASRHAAFVNAKAMQIAGVNPLAKESVQTRAGEGGEVMVDNNGNPTGLFNEAATDLIEKHLPVNDEEKALELALKA